MKKAFFKAVQDNKTYTFTVLFLLLKLKVFNVIFALRRERVISLKNRHRETAQYGLSFFLFFPLYLISVG